MKKIKTKDAIGHILCHDLTQIIKDEYKDARFRKGHVVTGDDIPILLSMGKEHLYVYEPNENILHENDAADILYTICRDLNMSPSPVKEGKIEVIANIDGVVTIDTEKLFQINSLGEMMIATVHNYYPVKKGTHIAGTRIIPLIIEKEKMERAKDIAGNQSILQLHPYKNKRVGIVTTGNEVKSGLIKDTFTPVVIKKIEDYGGEIVATAMPGDDPAQITKAILTLKDQGVDFIVCTGGMSVDPDDCTPLAIKNSGANVVSYGAPVLPGAMFMLAYFDDETPIVGLPGCVMYAKRTIFDLVLPRIMADIKINKDDINKLGVGGLCLNCEICTYPNCGFGKGM